MGKEPAEVPPLDQVGLEVHPTRTTYGFAGGGISAQLTFLTPALPTDLDVLSRPVTYLTWAMRSSDAQQHRVQLAFAASALLAVNKASQEVEAARAADGRLELLRVGTVEQPVLAKKGDNLRIDWGYLYLGVSSTLRPQMRVLTEDAYRNFMQTGILPRATNEKAAARSSASNLWLGISLDLGIVSKRLVQRTILVGYDDLYSIEYFGTKLRPYWRRSGASMEALLAQAHQDYERLATACQRFDAELEADLIAAGGEAYRRIGVLAYRQAIAGNKLAADANGQPLLFPKENFSNGCVATVDVLYPMSPQFLLLSPTLTKAMLVPILDYASSPRWKWPFAPHDLGTYPKANGQVYGGGEASEENQMPVEESGNMLILLAALAKAEGNASFAARYWRVVTKWAEYLSEKGFDPENQLCTDDFAGHLAHNVNLSAKAIIALAAYGMLCEMTGDKTSASQYRALAEQYAQQWVERASDPECTRLAFDRPGTWSQKYNLVWDRVLGFHLFPEAVLRKEAAWYRRVQNQYGLPLDSRKDYTKLDWTIWTACLTGDRSDFDALVTPVASWLQTTPDRLPMTDWYDTKSGRCVGFRARPVVGGVFIKLIADEKVWRKWAMRDR